MDALFIAKGQADTCLALRDVWGVNNISVVYDPDHWVAAFIPLLLTTMLPKSQAEPKENGL